MKSKAGRSDPELGSNRIPQQVRREITTRRTATITNCNREESFYTCSMLNKFKVYFSLGITGFFVFWGILLIKMYLPSKKMTFKFYNDSDINTIQ